jgi:glucose repression regulatory protein TUP1
MPNKRIRNIFRGHKFLVESVDFSPNGRLVVSTSWDRTLRIWNMRDGSAKVFTGNDLVAWSVRFSPNGQFVAVGSDMTDKIMRIWDVPTGQLVRAWTGHIDAVWSVVFTPDGKGLVSVNRDGVVKCWDRITRSSGEPVATKILKFEVCLLSLFDSIFLDKHLC